MPGALDVLVELNFKANDASLNEASVSVNKNSNVVKELTAALEKQGQAQTDTQKKIVMTAAEYRKMNEQLQVVKKGSTEYTEVLKKSGIEVEAVAKKSVALRTQLRTVREELAAMEIAGKANTAEFRNLSEQAGVLQDQIGDTSQRIRVLASDTKFLDAGVQAVQALAGAFAAGQGAIALFGEENEDVQRIIQKVMGALALLNGVQAVANALNKDSALNILLLSRIRKADTIVTEVDTAAKVANASVTTRLIAVTKGLTAAIAANPLGAAAAAILTVVSALALYVSATDDAEESAEQLNFTIERQNQLLDGNLKDFQRRADELRAKARAEGKSDVEIAKITRDELLAVQKQAEEKERLSQFAFGEAVKKAQRNNSKENQEAQEEARKAYAATTEARLNAESRVTVFDFDEKTKQNENAKKLAEKAAQEAKAANDKRTAAQKAADDQLLKYRQELSLLEASLQEDQRNRELAASQAATNNKIAQLKSETALTVDAQRLQNDLIALEVEAGQKRNLEIIKKYAELNRVVPISLTGDRIDPKTGVNRPETISADRLAGFEGAAERFGVEADIAKANADIRKQREEQGKAELKAELVNLKNTLIEGVNMFFDAEIRKTEFQISEQERRVEKAKEAAENGNAVLLKAEEDRLNELNKKKRDYVENQKGLNAALVASQSAVNVVQAVGGVIAAMPGDPYTLAARVAAAVVAVVGGIGVTLAAVKEAQGGYYEGGYTGDGNPRERAGDVHKREFVFDHKATDRIGVENLEALSKGKKSIADISRLPTEALVQNMSINYAGLLNTHNAATRDNGSAKTEKILSEVKGALASINESIKEIYLNVNISEDYISSVTDKAGRLDMEYAELRK